MLRPILAGSAAIAALSISYTPAAAADIPLPSGSYINSCKIVSFDQATGDLAANCQGSPVGMFGLGTPDTSRMNVRGCKEGSIWNDNRQLYCITESAWGNDRVIPSGSYIETCTDRKVVGGALLVATCGMPGGQSRNTSLDLRICTWGRDISNSNGTLRCAVEAKLAVPTQAISTTGSTSVVQPVAIEPGLVKPVAIVPLAPVEPAATGDDSDKKKKRKRRHNRDAGERG